MSNSLRALSDIWTFVRIFTSLSEIGEKLKSKRELLALIPLSIITIWLGVYPKPILEPINNSVESIVQLMHDKSITDEAKSRIPNLVKDIEIARTSMKEAH